MPVERRVCTCLALAIASLILLGGPVSSDAQAQGSPFGPLPPAQTATPTATAATTAGTSTTSSGSSVSSTTIYAALAGAVVLILAIGWFIARDARRVAPVPERSGGPSSKDIQRQRQRARARAKAARQQRKRNR